MTIQPGKYKHSKKGNEYRVHFVAKDSQTLADVVIYEALYDNDKSKYWVRPVGEFEEIVEVNGEKAPRFQKIK
ncbi:MAG: DUF1653 domain-containing protein [Candidatus Taylorbacteria bacterium]